MGGQEAGTTTNAEGDEMFPVQKTIFDLENKEHKYSFVSDDCGGAGPDTQKAMSRTCKVVPVEKIQNLKPEQINKTTRKTEAAYDKTVDGVN